ncbi:MAG: hypothetical protein Q4F11_04970 [Eubacteriales bacterium]|nr:hypothetical protein [Eubacteriales bacterium]
MYIRASVTIENCFIIPFFVLLFMSLISITGYYHDRLIIKCAVQMAALKLEETPKEEEAVAEENMRQQLSGYVSEKTLFIKNASVSIERKNGAVLVSCNGISAEIGENRPSNIIRKLNAAREVVSR